MKLIYKHFNVLKLWCQQFNLNADYDAQVTNCLGLGTEYYLTLDIIYNVEWSLIIWIYLYFKYQTCFYLKINSHTFSLRIKLIYKILNGK